MSFFSSRSSKGNHYRKGHHGSNHYQKKGILGNLLNIIASRSSSHGKHNKQGHYGSKHYQQKGILGNLLSIITSGSWSHSNHKNHYPNTPMNNQHTPNQNSMMCSSCSHQIPPGSKFCLQCGQKVSNALFCMSCGEKLPSGAKFCLKCGKKVND
jgi:ribosomal protein L40E